MKIERPEGGVFIHLTERVSICRSRKGRCKLWGVTWEKLYMATDDPPHKSYTAIAWRIYLHRTFLHGSFPISRSKPLR